MGWEKRKTSSKRYYTLTDGAGKQRLRTYIGRGEMAELAEAIDLDNRIQRELARRRREALRGPRRPKKTTVADDMQFERRLWLNGVIPSGNPHTASINSTPTKDRDHASLFVAPQFSQFGWTVTSITCATDQSKVRVASASAADA
jgi:hypothetical protein